MQTIKTVLGKTAQAEIHEDNSSLAVGHQAILNKKNKVKDKPITNTDGKITYGSETRLLRNFVFVLEADITLFAKTNT